MLCHGRQEQTFNFASIARQPKSYLGLGILWQILSHMTHALCVMQEGDPSHALYVKERQDLLDSLHRRASQLYKSLNQLEGITCNEPEGALYCMPRIRLSKKVLEVSLSTGHGCLGKRTCWI